jgi:hypothetical protein
MDGTLRTLHGKQVIASLSLPIYWVHYPMFCHGAFGALARIFQAAGVDSLAEYPAHYVNSHRGRYVPGCRSRRNRPHRRSSARNLPVNRLAPSGNCCPSTEHVIPACFWRGSRDLKASGFPPGTRGNDDSTGHSILWRCTWKNGLMIVTLSSVTWPCCMSSRDRSRLVSIKRLPLIQLGSVKAVVLG